MMIAILHKVFIYYCERQSIESVMRIIYLRMEMALTMKVEGRR